MIHHLLPSSPYTTRFLELLAAHPAEFPPEEHRFWLEHARDAAFRVGGTTRLRCERVGAWGFLRAFRALGPGDHVVIHQLSNPRLLAWLSAFRGTARRCAWVYWGGDVYHFRFEPRTLSHALRERLRRAVIPALPLVGGLVPGDFEVLRTHYGTRARYVPTFYPLPMDPGALQPVEPPAVRSGPVTLLVGNSGDPSNRHAWLLRALARFRGEDVRILAPLAYGERGHIAAVIALGRELFGERFTPLTEFLPPEQYSRLLREVDAVLMNHPFQQGLGNLVALLLLGKKVYVRSDTTSFPWFQDLGVSVFDTLRLPELSLPELAEFPPAIGARNSALIRAHLSEPNAVAGWRALFRALVGAPRASA
jgi:hypothetical protein